MNHSELTALIMFFGSMLMITFVLFIISALTLKYVIEENAQHKDEIEKLREWEALRHEETV